MYICSFVMYALKTWTIRNREKMYLQSFEIWQKMEKISWREKETNEEGLGRMKEEVL